MSMEHHPPLPHGAGAANGEHPRVSQALFRDIADHAPVMMWVSSRTGEAIYLNRNWYEFTGQTPATGLGFGWLNVVHPDDRSAAEETFLAAARAGAPCRIEYRLRRADGAYRWMIDSAAPRLDTDGAFLGYIGSILDIHDRKEAAERVRESEALFRDLADNAPVLVWVSDAAGAATFHSRSWSEFCGRTFESGLGFGWLDTVHPDDRERVHEVFVAAKTDRAPYRVEYRMRRADGAYRWMISSGAPRFAEDGTYLGHVGSVLDIDDRRQAEEYQNVLVAELQHRTRNLLGIVRSIAQRTLEDRPAVREFAERLKALSRVQTFLGQDEGLVGLDDLIRAELEAFPLADHGRVSIRGPRVRLPLSAVQTLALALHELTTNAAKYGALASPSGRLTINWRVEEGDQGARLQLDWREAGVTMPDETAIQRGYGRELIEQALPYQLQAETRMLFGSDGVHCTINLPLDR